MHLPSLRACLSIGLFYWLADSDGLVIGLWYWKDTLSRFPCCVFSICPLVNQQNKYQMRSTEMSWFGFYPGLMEIMVWQLAVHWYHPAAAAAVGGQTSRWQAGLLAQALAKTLPSSLDWGYF